MRVREAADAACTGDRVRGDGVDLKARIRAASSAKETVHQYGFGSLALMLLLLPFARRVLPNGGEEGERRFVRAYLPGADPDRDIQVNLRGSALGLRCERRVKYPDCDRKAAHHVEFDKVVGVPAGTTPDDVAAEYGEGVLLVSWPRAPSSARHTFPLTRCELPVE